MRQWHLLSRWQHITLHSLPWQCLYGHTPTGNTGQSVHMQSRWARLQQLATVLYSETDTLLQNRYAHCWGAICLHGWPLQHINLWMM